MKEIFVLILVIGVISCSSTASRVSSTPTKEDSTTKQSVQNIPSDSLFAKIKIGMGRKQVTDLIGHHSDMHTFSTGKIWIPFYFGSDTVRTVYYYKGKGRILFSRNGRVMKIDYDPSEDGYK